MEDKSFAKEPLLFINQPNITVPKAPMQDQYVTPKKIKVKDNDVVKSSDTAKQEIPKIRTRNNTFISQLSEPVADQAVDKEQKAGAKKERKPREAESKSTTKRKQFKDLTTRERVEYFLDSPSYTPKLKCEIKTSEKSYRGIITDFKEEIVFMQVGRKVAQIQFEEINNIRLLGF